MAVTRKAWIAGAVLVCTLALAVICSYVASIHRNLGAHAPISSSREVPKGKPEDRRRPHPAVDRQLYETLTNLAAQWEGVEGQDHVVSLKKP